MSKISIIIPAYNQASYLDRAITSALGQQEADIEVVVVDDGSTDNSPEIIARYQTEPRFKSVRQPNAGLAAARNRGLVESTGKYICFLDADDFYTPDKCAKQAALLDANPDLGFVYCDFTVVDENGVPQAQQGSVREIQRTLSGNIFPALAQSGYFPPHTVMIRRQVLDRVGHFDLELGGHADYDLWLRAAAEHPALYLDEKLASYREHGDSMSKDGDHMAHTRQATLRKISRLHPDLAGTAIDLLQQSNEDLFHANQSLRDACDKFSLPAASTSASAEHECVHSLMQHLSAARLSQGKADQMAVWDVVMNEQPGKALLLQPPIELIFEIPTGIAGIFATQIGLHPDVWENPQAGACEFQVQIDRRLALATVIDPAHLPDDRRWHGIRLEVPACPRGNHQVSLRTRSADGGKDFRWALWRNPRFSWTPVAGSTI
jgi:GT2 family glycosyltransferase